MKTLRTIIIGILIVIATMIVCNISTTANAETCPTCLPDAFDYVDFDSNTYAHYYNSDTGEFDIDYNTAYDIAQKQFEYYAKHNHPDNNISPATTTSTDITTSTTTTTVSTDITTVISDSTDTTTSDNINPDTTSSTTIVTSVTTDTTTSTSVTTATVLTTTTDITTSGNTTTDITISDNTDTITSDNNTNPDASDNTTVDIDTSADIVTPDTTTSDTTIDIATPDTTTSDTTIDIVTPDTTTSDISNSTTDTTIKLPEALKKLLADIKIYIDSNNSITIDYKFKDICKYILKCGLHHLTIDLFY